LGNAPALPQFYDATKVTEKGNVAIQPITWIAFPKQVKLAFPNDRQRWQVADSDRGRQDEYCEWSIKRDANGKMLRIVFCNEGPEYFEYLAKKQPDTLLEVYRHHNPGFDIKLEDLFIMDQSGSEPVYNPHNKWNNSTTTGSIMHLIQEFNTLGDEVDLGGIASVLRKDSGGNLVTDPNQLIKCSFYVNPDRNSDPTIGAGVNALARAGAMVTIENPIGLYIDQINWGLIETPDDTDPSEFWKWTRGKKGTYMRAVFEVPADKGYVLGDLTVKGIPLEFGGQLADFIRISLTGRASDAQGGNQIQPRSCSEGPRHHPDVPPKPTDSQKAASMGPRGNYYDILHNIGVPGISRHTLIRASAPES